MFGVCIVVACFYDVDVMFTVRACCSVCFLVILVRFRVFACVVACVSLVLGACWCYYDYCCVLFVVFGMCVFVLLLVFV